MIRCCIHRLPCIIRNNSSYFLCSKKTNTFCRTRSLFQKVSACLFRSIKYHCLYLRKMQDTLSRYIKYSRHLCTRYQSTAHCMQAPPYKIPAFLNSDKNTQLPQKNCKEKDFRPSPEILFLQSLILAMSVCLFFITDIDLNTVLERCQKKSCNHAKQKRIHQIYRLMLLIHKSSSHAIIYTIA